MLCGCWRRDDHKGFWLKTIKNLRLTFEDGWLFEIVLPGILEVFKYMLLGIVDLAFVSPSFSNTSVGSLIHFKLPWTGQLPMRSLSHWLQTKQDVSFKAYSWNETDICDWKSMTKFFRLSFRRPCNRELVMFKGLGWYMIKFASRNFFLANLLIFLKKIKHHKNVYYRENVLKNQWSKHWQLYKFICQICHTLSIFSINFVSQLVL